MPKSRRRTEVVSARAERTRADQDAADRARAGLRRYRARRTLGWSLVVLGVAVGVVHFLEHLGFFTLLPPSADGFYYPLAGLVGIAGAIVLSK